MQQRPLMILEYHIVNTSLVKVASNLVGLQVVQVARMWNNFFWRPSMPLCRWSNRRAPGGGGGDMKVLQFAAPLPADIKTSSCATSVYSCSLTAAGPGACRRRWAPPRRRCCCWPPPPPPPASSAPSPATARRAPAARTSRTRRACVTSARAWWWATGGGGRGRRSAPPTLTVPAGLTGDQPKHVSFIIIHISHSQFLQNHKAIVAVTLTSLKSLRLRSESCLTSLP